MSQRKVALYLALGAATVLSAGMLKLSSSPKHDEHLNANDRAILQNSRKLLAEGRETFRFDTFGDEDFWGGVLQLHKSIEGEKLGGVGAGLSPKTALGLGLKVDVDALPRELQERILHGRINLDDPATTLALLKLNAVIGVAGKFNNSGTLDSVGITCAMCHSVVDNSLAPGIGHRIDGWANRDINPGAIVASAPNLQPVADLFKTDVATVRSILNSWGPGKFDAELFLDGKATNPQQVSHGVVTGTNVPGAVLIPPIFGLQGVNLHTWTGWGSIPYWNAFVATIGLHGKGNFFDPRLDDATQFPIAAANRFGHLRSDTDLVTPKLPALHAYQLALTAPEPPEGSFNKDAAERGDALFSGKAGCANCHREPTGTDSGWNMHTAGSVCVDSFQADRAPDHRYRTSPLGGLWTHQKGGFYHDGRFANLNAVMDHYDICMNLGLTQQEKNDVVEYMKSLPSAEEEK